MAQHFKKRQLADLLGDLSGTRVHGGPSAELLTLLFEGIDNIADMRIDGKSLLQFACHERLKTMCHFLVDRGCTTFVLRGTSLTLGKSDLLELMDLCCGYKRGVILEAEPGVELFLLKRGIEIRKRQTSSNPVIQILEEGLRAASFSDRVELLKKYLMIEPAMATKTDLFVPPTFPKSQVISVTPLGALELLGTPKTEIWTGKNVIGLCDFMSDEPTGSSVTDEWKLMRPNEIEIQALQDIRSALLEKCTDPSFLFEPRSLTRLIRRIKADSVDFIERILLGRADVNFKDETGLTPLLFVLRSKSRFARRRTDVADILLKYGADINARDSWGRTAVFRAIALSDFEVAHWLIDHGADLSIPDNKGSRPIDIASYCVEVMMNSTDILERIRKIVGDTDIRYVDCMRHMEDLLKELRD